MKKFLFLALIIAMGLVCQTAFADDPSDSEVDEIQLREPLELERAVMEYMLAFEAYTAARRSKDPQVRGRLVPLMREYRNSYARFLEMLREDKLYRPNRPKDPAGWYDKKHEKTKGYKRDWKKTDAKELRAQVKEMVKNGASPEEIKAFIRSQLPAAPMSSDSGLTVSTSVSTARPTDTISRTDTDRDGDKGDDGRDGDDKDGDKYDGPKKDFGRPRN